MNNIQQPNISDMLPLLTVDEQGLSTLVQEVTRRSGAPTFVKVPVSLMAIKLFLSAAIEWHVDFDAPHFGSLPALFVRTAAATLWLPLDPESLQSTMAAVLDDSASRLLVDAESGSPVVESSAQKKKKTAPSQRAAAQTPNGALQREE
jgi:hypothetical protein